MSFTNIVIPFQLMLVSRAGWINRQQQDMIAYHQEESEFQPSAAPRTTACC
ncbi:MAG: hypothetical protein ACYTHJ_15180 [Planctomycetota bacterium]|jgi:hypothetical protein